MLNVGIEIEFTTPDIAEFLGKLYDANIDFKFFDKLDRHKRQSSKEVLVIKPDESLGRNGWEINIPPNLYGFEIKMILDILKSCNIELTDKCALHVHIDTYYLSKFNLDNIYKYYVNSQRGLIEDSKTRGLYLDLNNELPESPKDVRSRKTNLNFRAITKHGTLEHRIYKSTLNFDEVMWCVNQTINIIDKGALYGYEN